MTNPYGYYDAPAREYVITRPDTPTPWLNYLGQGGYGGIVSNTGGGYSFDRDPRNRRVTRYRYNSIPADQPGRYVYLRDRESGEFWGATWQPVTQVKLDAYECRHGAGYTRIRTERAGIGVEMLYFVPPGQNRGAACELWVLRLVNASGRSRQVDTCSYAEWSYWDALTDQQNLDWGQQIMRSSAAPSYVSAGVIFRPTRSFLGCSRPYDGFETDRETFIGRYRSLANPVMVESGRPSNGLAPRGNNIAALWHALTLEPGEEIELVYMLGVTDDPDCIAEVVRRYSDSAEVEAARSALAADWDRYLAGFAVELPDPEMQAMVNVWNPIQCRANLFWSRFASGYDTGLGRGMGTRDSAQDTLGTVHNSPEEAKDTLRMLWKLQFADGHAWHQVFPLTGEGGPGLAQRVGAYAPRDAVHAGKPGSTRAAAAGLCGLGRHDEPRPRERAGRERMDRAAVLPGSVGLQRTGCAPGPGGGGCGVARLLRDDARCGGGRRVGRGLLLARVRRCG